MLIKVLLAGLMSTCLSFFFKEQRSTIAFLIILAASLLIVFLTLDSFVTIIEDLNSIFDRFQGESRYFLMLLKMLGITYICDLVAGICKDSGHASIAHQMQTFGKVLILSVSVPIVSTLFDIISQLL